MTYTVLGTMVAIGFAVCTGFAQSTITTAASGDKQILAEPQTVSLDDSQSLALHVQLASEWTLDGDAMNPGITPKSDEEAGFLLGSFYGTNPSGTWTLFLADLGAEQGNTLPQSGRVITATPEPSTYALLGLGALLLIHHLRSRVAK